MNKINRYERKWIFKNINELEVTNILLRANLLFRFQYDNRSVNSIYFDDLNYSSIKENLDGVAEKKKYRIRLLIRSKNQIFMQKKLIKILDKMKISNKIKLTVDVDPINFT